jgi:hypothetical protein
VVFHLLDSEEEDGGLGVVVLEQIIEVRIVREG